MRIIKNRPQKNYTAFFSDKYLLIPMSLIALDGGPTKITPSSSHRFANSGFSERNPYPGWTALKTKK